jgi:hypothetical protein
MRRHMSAGSMMRPRKTGQQKMQAAARTARGGHQEELAVDGLGVGMGVRRYRTR